MAALVKVQAGSLAAALALSALPVSEKQAKRTPALAAVRLAADGAGACVVTITNLVATISISVEAEAAEGEMAVPFAWLADLADAFPTGAGLTITADDSTATTSFGKSRFKLPVFPLGALPRRHVLGAETGHTTLDAKVARDLFSRTAFAASNDPSRYYLNGIHLHSAEGALVATSTDGFRLARARVTTATSSTLTELIVPRELLKTIHRLLGRATGDVTLRCGRLFAIEGARFEVVTTTIDGTFPDTERIIPARYPNAATCSRTRLAEAIERFKAVADPHDTAHAVTMRWNGNGLTLSAPDGSLDGLAAETTGAAAIAIQIRYLSDLLEAMRGVDRIAITAGGPGDPVIITDPDNADFLAVQCPIRPRSSG